MATVVGGGEFQQVLGQSLDGEPTRDVLTC